MGAETFQNFGPFYSTQQFDLGDSMDDREIPTIAELEDRVIELEADSDDEMELRVDEVRNAGECAIAEIAIRLLDSENFGSIDTDTRNAAEKYLQFFFKKNTD